MQIKRAMTRRTRFLESALLEPLGARLTSWLDARLDGKEANEFVKDALCLALPQGRTLPLPDGLAERSDRLNQGGKVEKQVSPRTRGFSQT